MGVNELKTGRIQFFERETSVCAYRDKRKYAHMSAPSEVWLVAF